MSEFDLEGAIAQWRTRLSGREAFTEADLDEMESHLRDEIDARIASGEKEKDAFFQSVRGFGENLKLAWRFNQANWECVMLKRTKYMPVLIGNYFKVAFRNLLKYKVYSVINIVGLAIALAFCVLTFLFVNNEWTYDAYHENADRIYRVYIEKQGRITGNMPSPFGPAFSETFPEIKTVRFNSFRMEHLNPGDPLFRQSVAYADPTVFDVFSFPFVKGDPATALENKQSVVITEKIATKHFGSDNPLGQSLSFKWGNEMRDFVVTGVVQDMPENSTHHFDMLMLYEPRPSQDKWNYYMVFTYVLLPQNMSSAQIESQFPQLAKTWWGEESENEIKLQPLLQMHLDPTKPGKDVSNPVYGYVLSGIALLILFIACVNFTTLTIGRQATRTREVGLRKVVGAKRIQIAKQFIGESLLLILIALTLAIGLAELALPTFNTLAEKSFELHDSLNASTFVFLLCLTLLIGITAGGYPAFILSQLSPTQIMTSRLQVKTGNRFGRVLIIFQFALSIFLIVGTLSMAKQLDYLRSKPLGYQTDHVVAIQTYALQKENRSLPKVYQESLLSNPAVLGITGINHQLTNSMGSTTDITYEGSEEMLVENIWVDYNFFETLDVSLVAGRTFSKDFSTDQKEAIIINDVLAEELGLKNPLGETIKIGKRARTVIGVVQGLHFRSLHRKIDPFVMVLNPNYRGRLLIRLHPENVPTSIAFLKEKWEELAPANEFHYTFIDEELNKQYVKEERWNQMVQYATLFAIFIASMGAFGLAALAAVRRTKEIGIRKVMGASQTQILSLLSRDFLIHIAIASFVAFPITYYALSQWLQTFAYRIALEINVFLLGSAAMSVVVLLTVSYQAFKAARANPVDALRYE